MNNQKKIAVFIIAFCLVIFSRNSSFAVSATVKAENDYKYTLNLLRKMQTSIDNFSSEDKLSEYEKIKTQFNSAGEDYYGRNFSDAVIKFKALKVNMIPLLEKMAREYLTRTKALLDSTEKECFEIMVDFDKNSSFGRYFHKPFDPLKDKKPYNDKYSAADYHLFKDSDQIEQYLKEGYSCYNYSRSLFEDPEIAFSGKRQKDDIKKSELHYQRYVDV
jgi:hypothetical protein